MPPFDLYTRPNAARYAVIDDLLALVENGQQEAVDAAVVMLEDLFVSGAESRFAKKLKGLPIWELKTQARGSAKGGMRVYFYFRANGHIRLINAENKDGNTPSAHLLKEAVLVAKADERGE